MISESDIYRLQAHAIITGDQRLRRLAYTALGHDTKIAMMPTTPEEKLLAMQGCADQLEMLRAMGVILRTNDKESDAVLVINAIEQGSLTEPPVHVLDQTGQPYGSTRRCCNRCGIMVTSGVRYLSSIEEWRALPDNQRCA
jgi:hypothetical protein